MAPYASTHQFILSSDLRKVLASSYLTCRFLLDQPENEALPLSRAIQQESLLSRQDLERLLRHIRNIPDDSPMTVTVGGMLIMYTMIWIAIRCEYNEVGQELMAAWVKSGELTEENALAAQGERVQLLRASMRPVEDYLRNNERFQELRARLLQLPA